MKTKPFFKNLYSSHFKSAKVFILAGLMGGMTACKDVMEPEIKSDTQNVPTTQYLNDVNQNQSGDMFMKHLSDIDGAQFFIGNTDKIGFLTEGNGCVNGGWAYSKPNCDNNHDEHLNYRCISGKTTEMLSRVDNATVDSFASFELPKKYEFIVSGCFEDPREDWAIHEVDADDYRTVFQNMPDSVLAKMAKDRLEAVNADPGHIVSIYNAILQGKGRWVDASYGTVQINSKGAKVGLNHSDFGLVQGTTPIQGEPTKFELFPYSGGVMSKRLQAPSEPVKFKGKAYAVLHDNYYHKIDDLGHWSNGTNAQRIVSTDSAGATFVHGALADTLIMPFNGWYTVKVITKNGQQIDYVFEGSAENTWAVHNGNQNNIPAVIDESAEDLDFYAAEANGNGTMSIYMSVPDYYGAPSSIATGLDNVYCAPARKAKASDNSDLPGEVVMHGFIEEMYDKSAMEKAGVTTMFVFGGVNQNQR